jgi:hypothetical protein
MPCEMAVGDGPLDRDKLAGRARDGGLLERTRGAVCPPFGKIVWRFNRGVEPIKSVSKIDRDAILPEPPTQLFRPSDRQRELQAAAAKHRIEQEPLLAPDARTDDTLFVFHISNRRCVFFGRPSAWSDGQRLVRTLCGVFRRPDCDAHR